MVAANRYSPAWQRLFGAIGDDDTTRREVAFVEGMTAPAPARILDVGCGLGRHARRLAAGGHAVIGIERDPAVARRLRRLPGGGRVDVRAVDCRLLDQLPEASFDAVLSLWASFGWFDSASNQAVFDAMARRLAPGGVLIVDVFNPAFFAARQGVFESERRGVRISERKALTGGRLHVSLAYGSEHPGDVFDFELFTPDALLSMGGQAGLEPRVTCTGFDQLRLPAADDARYQLVMRRPAGC